LDQFHCHTHSLRSGLLYDATPWLERGFALDQEKSGRMIWAERFQGRKMGNGFTRIAPIGTDGHIAKRVLVQ
jgi:hypothetical protein